MSQEFETAALASAGGLRSGQKDEPDGPQCRNCGTQLDGRYCGACGQLSSNLHRPVWNLIWEGLADSFALDSRIARTLPALIFRPGHVTRGYLDGRRARYVPPFRLFLLSSLLFFFTMFAVSERLGWMKEINIVRLPDGTISVVMGEVEGEDIAESLRQADGTIDRLGLREAVDAARSSREAAETAGEEAAGSAAPVAGEKETGAGEGGEPRLRAHVDIAGDGEAGESVDPLLDRMALVYENQALFFAAVRSWAPRLSLLLLPLLTLLLGLLYIYRRRIYLYDHLIASMHFQSFLYISGVALILIGLVAGPGVLWIAAVGIPLYLYRLLRMTYGSGRIGAVLKTFLLVFVTGIALFVVTAGVVVLGALEI